MQSCESECFLWCFNKRISLGATLYVTICNTCFVIGKYVSVGFLAAMKALSCKYASFYLGFKHVYCKMYTHCITESSAKHRLSKEQIKKKYMWFSSDNLKSELSFFIPKIKAFIHYINTKIIFPIFCNKNNKEQT